MASYTWSDVATAAQAAGDADVLHRLHDLASTVRHRCPSSRRPRPVFAVRRPKSSGMDSAMMPGLPWCEYGRGRLTRAGSGCSTVAASLRPFLHASSFLHLWCLTSTATTMTLQQHQYHHLRCGRRLRLLRLPFTAATWGRRAAVLPLRPHEPPRPVFSSPLPKRPVSNAAVRPRRPFPPGSLG